MAGPYSDPEKKKYLRQVKRLLDQGYSLNAACRRVAERNDGRPSATSLIKWTKTAGLGNAAGPVTTAEGSSDQGSERDGNSAIAADPGPENTAQGQAAHQNPEPFADNADPAASEVMQASPAAVVDMPEEMDGVPERTPRLRGMVTTMGGKIRALRNLVKGHLGR